MVAQTQQFAPPNGHGEAAVDPPSIRIIYQTPSDTPAAHSYDYAVNFNNGVELFHRGDHDGALEAFSAADRAEPGQAQCVGMLGICYEHQKKHTVAMSIYEYALQLDPHYALVWHNKGVLHSDLGQLAEAKECYLNALRDRVLTGIPEFRTVATNLATVLTKLGEKDVAIRVVEEMLAQNPADNVAAVWLSDLHAGQRNFERAYDLLLQLPNSGQLRDGTMLLARSKMADVLINLAQPNAFRLPKASRLRAAYETAVDAAVKQLMAEHPGAALKAIDCDSIGWLAIKALRSGVAQATCLIKPWTALADAITETLHTNGIAANAAAVKFYSPDQVEALGTEADDAHLLINAIYAPAQVPGIINRVKAYKDKGLKTVPRSATIRIMGVSSEQIRTQCTVQSQVNGFDLTAFGDFCKAIRKYAMHMHVGCIPHEVLTDVVSLDIGAESDTQAFFGRVVDLPVLKGGRVDAIISWYDVDLADGVVLSMGPDEDCVWQQTVQVVHLDGDGVVKAGDVLHLKMTVTRWTAEKSHQWLMFEEVTHESDSVIKQRHDSCLLSEDPLEGRLWHFDMMADISRNNAYQRALEALVTPETIVLDVGTGSGLLSLMASRAGAKHVYAIEANASIADKARNVIRGNGYADRITVITGMSNQVTVGGDSLMPVQADLVVTETMGADLLSELMYNILHDARERLLKPNAIMIPRSGRVIGQLIQVDSPWHLSGFLPTEDLDLSAFNRLMPNMRICTQIRKVRYVPLSDVFVLFAFDFQRPLDPAGTVADITVPVTAAGTIHAIAYWWDAELGEEKDGTKVIIETGPDSRYATTDHAHWSQQLQTLDLAGRPVAPGSVVSLRAYNDNHLTFVEFQP